MAGRGAADCFGPPASCPPGTVVGWLQLQRPYGEGRCRPRSPGLRVDCPGAAVPGPTGQGRSLPGQDRSPMTGRWVSRSRGWFWNSSIIWSSCSVAKWGCWKGCRLWRWEQRHLGRLSNVLGGDLGPAFIGGDGAGRLVHDDVGPQAVNLVLGTGRR